MKKHYETHVEDTDKLISVAGPVLDYKSWYEQYRKLMEEQAQRKYGLYTPTSEGDDDDFPSISGMIARYSALGLTNEQMAENPIWVDKTGNEHDLQMKNFAWGGMSGVGGYVENYNRWTKSAVRADITFTDHSFNVTSVKINQAQFYYQSSGGEQPFTVPSGTVIVKGLTDGQVLEYIYTDIEGRHVFTVKNDGIYTLPSFEFIAKGAYYGFQFNKVQESCNITIEQIPEYEGYLITDGVDDEIVSAKLIQFADKFTIVGDWKFMEDRNDNAGLLKSNQIYIYNATTGMRIYLKQGSKNYPFSCKKINALTSDGWVYDEKWDKYKVYPIGSDIDISSRLFLGFYSSNFTKIALKNLGIYNNQLLSKDDCIKAYNYLQTLKSK